MSPHSEGRNIVSPCSGFATAMLRDRCTHVCQIVLEQCGFGTPDGKAMENTVRIWGLEATFMTLSLGDLMLGKMWTKLEWQSWKSMSCTNQEEDGPCAT